MTLAEFLTIISDVAESSAAKSGGKLTRADYDDLREWMKSEEYLQ